MNPSTKQKVQVTLEKIKGAFDKVTLKETKEYYVTLGNVNEIYLIKKDATKSVFLGRVFVNEDSTIEEESKKIWEVIGNYFRVNQFKVETQPEVVEEPKVETSKKTRKKKAQIEETPVVTAQPKDIEVPDNYAEDDEDYTWLDTVQ